MPSKAAGGQIKLEEILFPDLATAVLTRHLRQRRRAFQADDGRWPRR
jgi:hypothetical protein